MQNGDFNKFVVIKKDDCFKYLSEEQESNLVDILKEINWCRDHDHKTTDNKYLVINTDEPYANEVIEIMKRNGHWGQ